MDKQERASYMRELIKLYRKQGHSANKARQLAGEAMRETAQGMAWEAKSKRQADKLHRFMAKAIVEEIEGVTVTTLATKGTRRTYKNNGCRISAKAKTASNALFMDVAQGKGKSKAVYQSQQSDNIALTKRICADNARREAHCRAVALVSARRNVKRQLIKAMLYRMRTTPEHAATVWQVMAHVSVDYDAGLFNGVLARNAAYNASLSCAVPYNHAAFIACNSLKKD